MEDETKNSEKSELETQRYDNEEELFEKLKRAEEKIRKKALRDQKKEPQFKITQAFFKEGNIQRPGKNNWSGFGFDIHPYVTISSTVVLSIFITLTLQFKKEAALFCSEALTWISGTFGWFFILSANIFIIAALFFAFSRFGKIKIGGPNTETEFSTSAWFAMLISAGMGIGLMFWSVGEPISHYVSPSPLFNVQPGSPEAAQAAMGVTYFHWGLHPWAIYSIVALGMAFFAYNRGLPLTVRSIFYPILGNRIYGFWGNLIDVLSVLATLMGLATSLGLGVQQINAGLNFLFGLEISSNTQVILIIAITIFATMSVVTGLDGGVKRLSECNMGLAALFLLFLLIAGPTVYILSGFTQNLGFYLANITRLSLWTETFKETNWQGAWTVFYWAWWISWSPFVGMFIARISKGRTIREFILGVMVVPTLLSFLWMSVFGGSALFLQAGDGVDIAGAVQSNVATALFEMLKNFPMTALLSFIGIILVTIFFVTSSDSGSLVVDHLTSGGKLDSPIPQRVFWAVMEGVVAAVLLIGGGLKTLQTASITTGLPFTIVLLIAVYSLYMGLSQEHYVEEKVESKLQDIEEEYRLKEAIVSVQEELESEG